ncbi:protein gamma response 1-like [Populus alba x Populus x berolinensis]|uniref:Protein gamma response 1-like n=1 Tax=Populus alba x Populus x berolinensis TaxID=444605 RepID=A0AAD6MG23_9ROSI|nr:protein gamma response 1-like [Populus alba x Populus x berolinensis]
MKGELLECCPKLEAGDVSGLSTILVATIQEAKDRISQIEYIFSNQLYPNFQTKCKSLLKIYSDAEEVWKEKEQHLLELIEKLRVEKQEVVEENKLLKVGKEKSAGEPNEKENVLLAIPRNRESKIDELEQEVMKKYKEVGEGMELQNTLPQLVQTKAAMIVDKGRELKMNEEKTNELLAKVKSLEKHVEELQEEVRTKTEKVAEKTELANSLSKKALYLLKLIEDNEKLRTEHEKEKEQLMYKVECLEENLGGLKKKFREKTEEIEEGRVLQAELLQQIEMNAVDILKQKEQLEKSENDKKVLLDKVNGLEEKVNELQANLSSSVKEAERKVSYENLLHRIELKDCELLAEKRKMSDLRGLYIKLRSQYKYLCTKSGLTMKNMLNDKLEDESGSLKHQLTTSTDRGNKNVDASAAPCEMKEVKTENEFSNVLVDNEVVKSIPIANFKSPTSGCAAPKCPPTVKSTRIIGTKRPASSWIDTRSRQGKDGPDPHDDFLDTPLENLRADLDKAMKEEVHDPHVVVQKEKNMDPGSSDDETQDANVDRSPGEQRMPVPIGGKGGFKYVEPVRKKAERQNLKGVQCKQCKKFYDAVLPTNGGKSADGNQQNVRCEHHDGVSRHRYKYAPPLTPEGFWNIGFESEM